MNASDAGGAEPNGARLHVGVGLLGQSLELSRGLQAARQLGPTHFHGQLGEEEGTKEGLGISIEGLHVAEKASYLPDLIRAGAPCPWKHGSSQTH